MGVFSASGRELWTTSTAPANGSTTQPNPSLAGTLLSGQSVASPDGRFSLSYQSDGNLVINGPGGALWGSGTNGTTTSRVVMQSDGNLVIYNGSNQAIWSTGTGGNANAKLYLRDTGRLDLVSSSGQQLWTMGIGANDGYTSRNYEDEWFSIENITGTNYDDTLTGLDTGSTIKGLAGNDVLNGGAANDVLEGGAGADQIAGGGGTNTASYAGSTQGVYVNLTTGTTIGGDATGDVLSGIQYLQGSASGDELMGTSGANYINAGAGDDWIDASAGADTNDGGDGFDTIDYSQTSFVAGAVPAISANLGAGTVTVRNADGSTTTQNASNEEQIIGTSSNDSFSGAGTAWNFTWDGDGGTDTISGGSGSDTYVFGRGYGNVTVTDNNSASNTIKLKSAITFDDIWAYNNGGALQVGLRGQSGSLAVGANFVSANNVVNDVVKTLDLGGVAQVDLTQIDGGNILTDSADTFNGSANISSIIFANNGNDTINASGGTSSTKGSIVDGGLGDDTITTSTGDDQFLFERGDGHDVVTDTGGQNTIVFGSTVGVDDVLYQIVGNDLYVGIKDLSNSSLTANQVSDNIKITGGGVEYIGTDSGVASWNTNISIEAGGATTDLIKSNLAWTVVRYHDGGVHPIIFDLNGDGLELSTVAKSDIITQDSAGNVLRTSWVGPTNGILASDRDGDGRINNTGDISFVRDKNGATTDLEGLSAWDTDGDGVLTAKDQD